MTEPASWPYPPAATVPMAEARARLSSLVDLAERTRGPVVLTRNGRPAAVLVDAAEWEIIARLADAAEDQEARRQLAEGLAEATGAVSLAEALAELDQDQEQDRPGRRAG